MRLRAIRFDTPPWKLQYAVLGTCIASYFAIRFTQVVIGPIVPGLIDEFDVSRGMIGITLTGMWITYALSQLPSGVFADRYGEYRIVVLSLLTTGIASLALAGTPTFLLFGIGVVGLGVGAGMYYNPATALLSREFSQLGKAIGSHRMGGQIAGVIAPIVAAGLVVRFGWRSPIIIGAIVTIVAIVVFTSVNDSQQPVRPAASVRELFAPSELIRLLRRPHTRFTTYLATLVEFVGLAAMAFIPIMLIEHVGFSTRIANLSFAVFYSVAAISQPLGGWLSDRIGRDTTIAVQSLCGAVGYSVITLKGSMIVIIGSVALAGVAMSLTPVVQSRMLDGLSADSQGTGFGLFRTVYLLFGSLGTTVVGATADFADWRTAIGILACLMGLIFLSILGVGLMRRFSGSIRV